jgi:hypothetical protein
MGAMDPKLRHNRRARQRYSFRHRCNAPVSPSGRCGQLLTGVQRIPVEVDGRMLPGPVLTHRPCGHSWRVGRGWDYSTVVHSGQ